MANRTRFIDEKVQSVEVAFGYINVPDELDLLEYYKSQVQQLPAPSRSGFGLKLSSQSQFSSNLREQNMYSSPQVNPRSLYLH